MDLLVPEVVSLVVPRLNFCLRLQCLGIFSYALLVQTLISKLGAMMVLIKAGFMSLCHSLEEGMAL